MPDNVSCVFNKTVLQSKSENDEGGLAMKNLFRVTPVISIFVIGFVASGCSTNVKLTPQAASDQKIVYQDGRQALISEIDNVVTLAPSESVFVHSGQAKFIVAVKNQSERDILFSTSNLVAQYDIFKERPTKSGSAKSSSFLNLASMLGFSKAEASPTKPVDEVLETRPLVTNEPLKVFSYEELQQGEKKRQAIQAFAAALSGIGRSMQAANAGRTYSSGSYNSYGSYGNNTYGSYSGYSYDPYAAQAAQSAAQAQTDADFARIKASGERNMAELSRTILKMQTVAPGQWYGGTIVVQMPDPKDGAIPVMVRVNIGSDVHEFRYHYEKVVR